MARRRGFLPELMSALDEKAARDRAEEVERARYENDRYRTTLGAINRGAETMVDAAGTYLTAQEAKEKRREDTARELAREVALERRHQEGLGLERERLAFQQNKEEADLAREEAARKRQAELDAQAMGVSNENQRRLREAETQAKTDREATQTALKLRGSPTVSAPVAEQVPDGVTDPTGQPLVPKGFGKATTTPLSGRDALSATGFNPAAAEAIRQAESHEALTQRREALTEKSLEEKPPKSKDPMKLVKEAQEITRRTLPDIDGSKKSLKSAGIAEAQIPAYRQGQQELLSLVLRLDGAEEADIPGIMEEMDRVVAKAKGLPAPSPRSSANVVPPEQEQSLLDELEAELAKDQTEAERQAILKTIEEYKNKKADSARVVPPPDPILPPPMPNPLSSGAR